MDDTLNMNLGPFSLDKDSLLSTRGKRLLKLITIMIWPFSSCGLGVTLRDSPVLCLVKEHRCVTYSPFALDFQKYIEVQDEFHKVITI